MTSKRHPGSFCLRGYGTVGLGVCGSWGLGFGVLGFRMEEFLDLGFRA